MSQQWIEVEAGSLASNMRVFRELVGPDVILAPVVKSNGYGHGLGIASRAFVAGGADWLCVHAHDEAMAVIGLELGVEVLQLGPVDPSCAAEAMRAGVHLTFSEPERLEQVLAIAGAASAASDA